MHPTPAFFLLFLFFTLSHYNIHIIDLTSKTWQWNYIHLHPTHHILYIILLLSAKHDLPMPNLFITSGWAYLCFMTSPLIRFPYRQEVLQMPVQA